MTRALSDKKLKSEYLFILRIFSIVLLINILISNFLNGQDSDIRLPQGTTFRKNSIYLEILGNGAVWSLNYDRIIPLKNNNDLVIRAGGNEYHSHFTDTLSFNFIGTVGFLTGGPVNFFEASVGYTHFTNGPDRLIIFTSGYRFQGRKGLVLRFTPMYIYNTEKGDTFGNSLWIGASFGYSF